MVESSGTKASEAGGGWISSISRRSRGGQAEMNGLGGSGLKTTMQAGFPVYVSKSRTHLVRLDGENGGLSGLKIQVLAM